MDNRRRPTANPKNPTNVARVIESRGSSRAPLFFDTEAVHRMIEAFGPMDYAEFSDTQDKLLAEAERNQDTDDAPSAPSPARESILQWFDKAVEKELEKRRDLKEDAPPMDVKQLLNANKSPRTNIQFSRGTAERIAEMTASRIEISMQLKNEVTTELTDAVEKLAKAEQILKYHDALQAAEAAAQNAPPELAERLAAAEARKYQTELTEVCERVGGNRPIEVVGYVGITKPQAASVSKKTP